MGALFHTFLIYFKRSGDAFYRTIIFVIFFQASSTSFLTLFPANFKLEIGEHEAFSSLASL